MPMPPPKSTTESNRDRQVLHEMGQIVRALEDVGSCGPEDLADLVGARYWEAGRFDRAVALAVSDGLIVTGPEGVLQPSG